MEPLMNWAILTFLVPLSSPNIDTGATVVDERARLVRELEMWERGARYVGLTENELLRELGEPASKAESVWTYRRRTGVDPQFLEERIVRFVNGRVVSAPLTVIPLGCTTRGEH